MEWTIKIENKPNQRIFAKFEPQNDVLVFIGQYKPHNKEWVDFCVEKMSFNAISNTDFFGNTISPFNINETIEDKLFNIYDKMKKKLEIYTVVVEGFSNIKIIEILDDIGIEEQLMKI